MDREPQRLRAFDPNLLMQQRTEVEQRAPALRSEKDQAYEELTNLHDEDSDRGEIRPLYLAIVC